MYKKIIYFGGMSYICWGKGTHSHMFSWIEVSQETYFLYSSSLSFISILVQNTAQTPTYTGILQKELEAK